MPEGIDTMGYPRQRRYQAHIDIFTQRAGHQTTSSATRPAVFEQFTKLLTSALHLLLNTNGKRLDDRWSNDAIPVTAGSVKEEATMPQIRHPRGDTSSVDDIGKYSRAGLHENTP